MMYQSVTVWKAMPFLVELRYGRFSTPAYAASMARTGIQRLVVDQKGLWVDTSYGTRAPVRDGAFTVLKLRDESARSADLNMSDFDPVPMTAADMFNEPAMRSFGSVSYGVCDEAGNPVPLPELA